MIGYLRGQVLDNTDGRMIVVLGSGGAGDGAVGYAVTVPNSPSYIGFTPGKPAELFVHTHVREDALDLYGFATRLEKDLFLTLLGVTGIGPKGAIGILSKVEPSLLVQAILDGDKDSLTSIPGIGKKTAERVVLELQDPLRKKMEAGGLRDLHPAGAVARPRDLPQNRAAGGSVVTDAKAALIGLGYRETEVTALLNRVMAEAETPPARAEDLVRTALRQLV